MPAVGCHRAESIRLKAATPRLVRHDAGRKVTDNETGTALTPSEPENQGGSLKRDQASSAFDGFDRVLLLSLRNINNCPRFSRGADESASPRRRADARRDFFVSWLAVASLSSAAMARFKRLRSALSSARIVRIFTRAVSSVLRIFPDNRHRRTNSGVLFHFPNKIYRNRESPALTVPCWRKRTASLLDVRN
jgi:hypothetical protein